ncbi:hypothetical protein Tco_1196240 [Tanacetum coccineum]
MADLTRLGKRGFEEEFESSLRGESKAMFDPPSEEDVIWKLPQSTTDTQLEILHRCMFIVTVEVAHEKHIYMPD